MNLLQHTVRTTVMLAASVSPVLAQNMNQAAVDTLTKDVAIAIFAPINQPKAQEIYTQLLACDNGCDPQQIIRGVGSWDQVGAKMQELNELKNTARFINLPTEEANTAIREQLARFYEKYKSDRNYGVPLSQNVQAKILAKIDALLPPATLAPAPVQASSDTTVDSGSGISVSAVEFIKLERRANDAEKKQFWMLVMGVIGGLLIGAAGVYLLAYRSLSNEVNRLREENRKLSKENDKLSKKSAPVNSPRKLQDNLQLKASAYDSIVTELGTDNPLAAIRQLKQQQGIGAGTTPNSSQHEAIANPTPVSPSPEPQQAQAGPVPQPVPLAAPALQKVFYFPPPDPNGQFDSQQKTSSLSPESAYCFSLDIANPALATFRFEAEPGRVARFLTYRNYMIEPACDSENSYTSTHTRITMRRDGEALLENGSWRVKTKALIRYE